MKRVLAAASILVLAGAGLASCRSRAGGVPDTWQVEAQRGLDVERLRLGLTNCYVVRGIGSLRALVIDPGSDAKRVASFLESEGLECAAIVHTHGHEDHTGATRELQRLTSAPLWRHPLQRWEGSDTRDLVDGQTLSVGTLSFRVVHTPGHAPGSVCLYGHEVLFTGDTLFRSSVGRQDLAGGSQTQLLHSIRTKLAFVPDAAVVLPGHGEASSMGVERRTNPYLAR